MWRIPAHHPPGEGADPRRHSAHAPALRCPCTGHGPLGPSHLTLHSTAGACVAKDFRITLMRRMERMEPAHLRQTQSLPKEALHLFQPFILWPDVDPVWNPSSWNPASPLFCHLSLLKLRTVDGAFAPACGPGSPGSSDNPSGGHLGSSHSRGRRSSQRKEWSVYIYIYIYI